MRPGRSTRARSSRSGGQDEGDVGVAVKAVQGLQGLEQGGVGVPTALLGNEVAVLEDHDGRLVGPRQFGGLVEQSQRLAGEEHRRRGRRHAEQVSDEVGFACARRSIQEHAALEMLTRGPQHVAPLPDADDVPADTVQHPGRQDHLVGAHPRAREETQIAARVVVVEVVRREREHLAAQDAVLRHQLPQPAQEEVDRPGLRAQDFQGVGVSTHARVAGAVQDGQRNAVEPQQAHTEGDDATVAVRPRGHPGVADGARLVVPVRVHQELPEGLHVHPVGTTHPQELPAVGVGEPLRSHVEVDDLMLRILLGHRVDRGELDAEEVADDLPERGQSVLATFGGTVHRFQELLERTGKLRQLDLHASRA